jgi:E3 ubiquitin-protein ligase HECTD4
MFSFQIAEYGGNPLGFGSKSVLGTGWPSGFIPVDGEAVTFVFEMRSGREQNVPDKALWGFKVAVRATDVCEKYCPPTPLVDLCFNMTGLAGKEI